MLTKLLAMTKAELKSKIQSIDESAIKGRALRRQLAGMKKKEGGFTLLELLVVVAILAAIAGTATIMLHDTDKKAFAAAHVAMMDELSKGILTFKQINGTYPNNWDSLMASADGTLTAAAPTVLLNSALYDAATPANGAIINGTITAAELATLTEVGITTVRVIDNSIAGCAPTITAPSTTPAIVNTIKDKTNDITVQNIFRTAAANGCGAVLNAALAATTPVMVWQGDLTRVNAPAGSKLVAFGIGPDTTLFQSTQYGGLTRSESVV